MKAFLATIAVLAVLGCSPDTEDRDASVCDGMGAVVVTASIPSGGAGGHTADVVVNGTAEHENGATIRNLHVVLDPGSLARSFTAEKVEENFLRWRITLPVDALRETVPVDAMGPDLFVDVELAAVVDDACSDATSEPTLGLVRVNREAGILVSDLAIDAPNFVNGVEAVPANGEYAILITASASASSSGATVAFGGDGLVLEPAAQRLFLDGERSRTLAVSVTSTMAGQHVLTAESKGSLATRSILVVGPPQVSPQQWTLQPGGQVPLSSTNGTSSVPIVCQASPSASVSVTSGGADISLNPGGVDADGNGTIDLVAVAADDATPAASVTITCRDAFDQFGTANVMVAPAGG